MLAVLQFVFQDFEHWLGALILIVACGTSIAMPIAAWKDGDDE